MGAIKEIPHIYFSKFQDSRTKFDYDRMYPLERNDSSWASYGDHRTLHLLPDLNKRMQLRLRRQALPLYQS